MFIIGMRGPDAPLPPPVVASGSLPIGVRDALGDLPPIGASRDGSDIGYIAPPGTPYQMLMRGEIRVAEYLSEINGR